LTFPCLTRNFDLELKRQQNKFDAPALKERKPIFFGPNFKEKVYLPRSPSASDALQMMQIKCHKCPLHAMNTYHDESI